MFASRSGHYSIKYVLKWKETHPQPSGKTGKGQEESFQRRRLTDRQAPPAKTGRTHPLHWQTPQPGRACGKRPGAETCLVMRGAHLRGQLLGAAEASWSASARARTHTDTQLRVGWGLTLLPRPQAPGRWRCRSAPEPGGRSLSADLGASGRLAGTSPPGKGASRRGGLSQVLHTGLTGVVPSTPDPKLSPGHSRVRLILMPAAP